MPFNVMIFMQGDTKLGEVYNEKFNILKTCNTDFFSVSNPVIFIIMSQMPGN